MSVTDFLAMLGQWGGPGTCDFDGGGVGVSDFLALLAHWGQQFGIGAAPETPDPKFFLPDDIFWPRFPNLMNPAYWLSGWHLADLAQQALLGDRVGLVLVLVLLPGALLGWRRGRERGWRPELIPLVEQNWRTA